MKRLFSSLAGFPTQFHYVGIVSRQDIELLSMLHLSHIQFYFADTTEIADEYIIRDHTLGSVAIKWSSSFRCYKPM